MKKIVEAIKEIQKTMPKEKLKLWFTKETIQLIKERQNLKSNGSNNERLQTF